MTTDHCSQANFCTGTQYRLRPRLYRDSRIRLQTCTCPDSYREAKTRAVLRSLRPHRHDKVEETSCFPACNRSATFTNFIAGPLAVTLWIDTGTLNKRIKNNVIYNVLSNNYDKNEFGFHTATKITG